MCQMICPILEGLCDLEGGDASDGAGTGAETDEVRGGAGPRWLVDADSDVSLLASVRRLWRAGAPDFDEHGIRIETSRRLTQRMTAGVQVSRHTRSRRLSTGLDGPVMDVTVQAGFVALPDCPAQRRRGLGARTAGCRRGEALPPYAAVGAARVSVDLP